MPKFKIDENLPIEIKALLISNGFDAMTVFDQKLGGKPDSKIATVCQSESRCIVTLDLDFCDIRNYPPHLYQGIVVIRSTDQSKDAVLGIFASVINLFKTEPVAGKLWIVESDRVRIRE